MTKRKAQLAKVVSGGQTGVDRGALDAAIEAGVEHGGWCPLGRRSEEGRIPPHYRLEETTAADYKVRTEQNVLDSDGTLILCRGQLGGGTLLTRTMASDNNKPCRVVDLDDASGTNADLLAGHVRSWLKKDAIRILNVAGPRESQNPGIALDAKAFLLRVLTDVAAERPDD